MEKRILGIDPGLAIVGFGAINWQKSANTTQEIKIQLNYGKADKAEVQEAVMRELDLDEIPRPDDAADALAVALTASFQL